MELLYLVTGKNSARTGETYTLNGSSQRSFKSHLSLRSCSGVFSSDCGHSKLPVTSTTHIIAKNVRTAPSALLLLLLVMAATCSSVSSLPSTDLDSDSSARADRALALEGGSVAGQSLPGSAAGVLGWDSSNWGAQPQDAADLSTVLLYKFSHNKDYLTASELQTLVVCSLGHEDCPEYDGAFSAPSTAINSAAAGAATAYSLLSNCTSNKALEELQCQAFNECLTSSDLLELASADESSAAPSSARVSAAQLRRLLPLVLAQAQLPECRRGALLSLPGGSSTAYATGTSDDPSAGGRGKPTPLEVWGYGLLFVTLISACSLVGVSVLPLMARKLYQQLLTGLIGLAAGSLAASSLFHLLPQAFRLPELYGNHDYLFPSLYVLIGLWAFLMIERCIKMCITVHERRTAEVKTSLSAQVMLSSGDEEAAWSEPDGGSCPTDVSPASPSHACALLDDNNKMAAATSGACNKMAAATSGACNKMAARKYANNCEEINVGFDAASVDGENGCSCKSCCSCAGGYGGVSSCGNNFALSGGDGNNDSGGGCGKDCGEDVDSITITAAGNCPCLCCVNNVCCCGGDATTTTTTTTPATTGALDPPPCHPLPTPSTPGRINPLLTGDDDLHFVLEQNGGRSSEQNGGYGLDQDGSGGFEQNGGGSVQNGSSLKQIDAEGTVDVDCLSKTNATSHINDSNVVSSSNDDSFITIIDVSKHNLRNNNNNEAKTTASQSSCCKHTNLPTAITRSACHRSTNSCCGSRSKRANCSCHSRAAKCHTSSSSRAANCHSRAANCHSRAANCPCHCSTRSTKSIEKQEVDLIFASQQQAIKASFGHEQKPHPSGHSHQAVEYTPGETSVIRTVAWMIIFGDGFHNFLDGVSMGAAFSQSKISGISISLAVMCEELPHELGDFAVLLNAGMSMRQALMYNFLSATTCYAGLVVGILLGEFTQDASYIFALAGGMFLYISCVDMIPELNEVVNTACEKGTWRDVWWLMLLQNLGLGLGVASLFALAYFQDNITLA